jgi:hypothetical protein
MEGTRGKIKVSSRFTLWGGKICDPVLIIFFFAGLDKMLK